MTKKVLFLIRYICLIWLIIYLIISIFKFIQINIRINEKYGIVSKKFFVVGYTNESIVIDNILLLLDRIVFPHFNPFYRYTVPEKMSTYIVFKTSFMDGKFSVTMNDGIITRDNFYEVLIKDDKFQHLYSNWVKKQVGIEDENVELEFKGALRSATWVGEKPYIEFDKITSLENLAEQICENTHNLYLDSIDKKISNIETKDDWLQTSKMIRDEYVDKIKDFNLSLVWDNEVAVKLYYYDVDLVNDRYNHIGLKNDNTNFYYILFNLNDNNIKYLSNYYDCTGASVLQSWLKEIDN